MDDFQFFENTQNLFKNKEDFQRAYNTLKEVIKSNIDSPQKLLDLHQNTCLRLLKAFYHLENLKQLKCDLGKSVPAIKLIFIHYEELLSSLQSSLDALAYEINEIYQLNLGKYIDIRKIMDELPESRLRDFLQKELQLQNREYWYYEFRQERNVAIHRPTKLLEATIQTNIDLEKEEIEEDIVAKNMKVFGDSITYYEHFTTLFVGAYRYMTEKIIEKEITYREDIKGELLSKIECPYCHALIAWQEKRTVNNWPTEAEKEKYDFVNYEKQIVIRSTGPISIFAQGKLNSEDVENSIVDLEDTVCILEKLPPGINVSCPACDAKAVIRDDIYECIRDLLREANEDVPLTDIEEMIDKYDSDFWHEPTLVRLTFQIKIWRYRYYASGKEREDMERRKKLFEKKWERKIVDETIDKYKGKKIYKKKFGTPLDRFDSYAIMLNQDIQEEEYGYGQTGVALFYRDKDEAISFLQHIVADYYYMVEKISPSKTFYAKSLQYSPQNGDSWLGLGLIDILEGNEKEGITKCLKAGQINKKHYFGDVGLAFYERGELDKAKGWLKKDFNKKKTAKTSYSLGIVTLKQDDVEQGIDWFQKSLRLNSQYWDSYIALGLSYEEVGKIDRAIKILEEGMEQIIDRNKEGKFFYKDEGKAKKMHSLLKRLKGEKK